MLENFTSYPEKTKGITTAYADNPYIKSCEPSHHISSKSRLLTMLYNLRVNRRLKIYAACFMWFLGISFIDASAQVFDSTYIPKFRVYTYEGETFMSGRLDTIDITRGKPSQRELKRGRKRLKRYTRLRYNVHKVYPYAQKLSEMLIEVANEMEALESESQRKEYVKNKEKSLFGTYEDDIRRMTRSQGKVLVKLVYRETGSSTFNLIKDHKSGASAMFWQSISIFFGINLKEDYNPEEEEMIEMIVQELERGGYNIAYRKYNYSLDDG